MEDMGKIDINRTLADFEDHGGFCDCEILWNVAARSERTGAKGEWK
jgi:hypothetical protein